MVKIKPCPCGKVPTKLKIYFDARNHITISGDDCCDLWEIEFKVPRYIVEKRHVRMFSKSGEECDALALEAWNAAPRG